MDLYWDFFNLKPVSKKVKTKAINDDNGEIIQWKSMSLCLAHNVVFWYN